jgi:hypothetical protein
VAHGRGKAASRYCSPKNTLRSSTSVPGKVVRVAVVALDTSDAR